ncbi:MAG: alpha/beta fold hydrolase [Planctomycetota bacterium]
MRLLKLLVLVLLCFGGLLWGCQRKVMYPGAWMDPGPTLPLPEGTERWTHDIGSGAVEAILLPSHTATADQPGPAVIFLHGNGEFIDQWAHQFQRFNAAGVTVLLPEYRGYGNSAGKPSQSAILDDLVAYRQRLIDLEIVDANRVVYIGRSLGGGFAAQLADSHPPAALVLSSTFTSAADAAHDLTGLPRWMVRDSLEVRRVLEDYPGPVLIVHGEDDSLLGVHHAQANAQASPRAELVIYPRTGHDNMPEGMGRWETLESFFRAHGLLMVP